MDYPPDSLEASVSAAVVAAIKLHEIEKARKEKRASRIFAIVICAFVTISLLCLVFMPASPKPVAKASIEQPVKAKKAIRKNIVKAKKVVDEPRKIDYKNFIGPRD